MQNAGEQPMALSESDMIEILDTSVKWKHMEKLIKVRWDLHNSPFKATISKLEMHKPAIKKAIENENKLSKLLNEKDKKW